MTSPTLTSLSLESSDEESKDMNYTNTNNNENNENNENNCVLLPLIDLNNLNNLNAPQIQRPHSILKSNSHKRSCSAGLYHYLIHKNHFQNILSIVC
jgi:hypothetical protein